MVVPQDVRRAVPGVLRIDRHEVDAQVVQPDGPQWKVDPAVKAGEGQEVLTRKHRAIAIHNAKYDDAE